ncbi:hypothetical protein [Bacillus sp. 1NLA3E]|uniref:hypothetical protein n=1 Tax=Bacillus sp. 1NLA3E TaxID=666686 RepID=UPI000247F1F6|nr:hypothetical protein [Bacillus sp. 1NLA3E]
MKKTTKSKWIVGLAGTAFSAFVLGQIGSGDANNGTKNGNAFNVESKVYASMNDKEKELVKLDWSDFTISDGTQGTGAVQSDRQSSRS